MTTLFADAYRDRRVLVTGHTGFKGSWLTSWLLSLGAEVCGYSDAVPTTPSLFDAAGLSSRIRDERGDIRDAERVAQVISDFRPDFVLHLAAQAIVSASYADPLDTISVNVMGTAAVLEALRRVDHPCIGVIITSDKVYENVEWPWGYRETDRLAGKDVYSGSKSAAELVVHSYRNSFFNGPDGPVRLATVRAGNVVGGGDWAANRIVADCVRAWSQGRRVQIRSPKATRPWQHVLESLSGYLALGAKLRQDPALHGESFNFGPRADESATVQELLFELAQVWGFEDPSASYELTGDRPFHEAGLLRLNIDKALLVLRWAPTLSHRECVELTGSWYREVVKNGADAATTTDLQLRAFEDLARERRRAWAV